MKISKSPLVQKFPSYFMKEIMEIEKKPHTHKVKYDKEITTIGGVWKFFMIKELQGQAQTYTSYEILFAHRSTPNVIDLINKDRTEYRREFHKDIIYEWNLYGMSE